MKVTVCQIDSRADHIESELFALADHCKNEESDFLLLPELGLSDWLAAEPFPDEEKWSRSIADHDRRIGRLENFGVQAVLGTRPVINHCGSRRNQAFIWSRDKKEAQPIREKYYLPDEEGYWEHTWYERGTKSFNLARAIGMRIGVQICTEMWFFEWARQYAQSRADLLCVPRVTPHGSTEKWLAGGQAAAVCSGAYCLSSNIWCPPGDKANCGGLAWVTDPEGNVLATTDTESPFATVEIDLDFAKRSKLTYPRYVPE